MLESRFLFAAVVVAACILSVPAFAAVQTVPFSEIPGIKVGHVSDYEHGTGCTVVIAENPNGGVESKSTTWNRVDANMNLLGVLAVNAMQSAIVSAAINAETLLGVRGAASPETRPVQPGK